MNWRLEIEKFLIKREGEDAEDEPRFCVDET